MIAAVLFAGAVLARETMVLVAIGAFAFVWFRDRRRPGWLVAGPRGWALVAVGSPALGESSQPDRSRNAGGALRGLWTGISNWISTGGLNLALGVLVVFCAAVIVASSLLRPSLLAWATVGFVPLMLILHPAVTIGGLNITRAVAPVVSAALVLVFGRRPSALPVQTSWS